MSSCTRYYRRDSPTDQRSSRQRGLLRHSRLENCREYSPPNRTLRTSTGRPFRSRCPRNPTLRHKRSCRRGCQPGRRLHRHREMPRHFLLGSCKERFLSSRHLRVSTCKPCRSRCCPRNPSLLRHKRSCLYGTTAYGGGGSGCGGNNGCGTVYKLTPSNGGWTESVLYSFQGGSDGAFPYAGVIFDQAGNLYGTTAYGGGSGCAGNGCGTVFQLTSSGSGWVENTLYSFQGGNDGASPFGGLIFDQSGNLYGSTAYTSSFGVGGGTVFELSPSGSNWIHTVLYSFSGGAGPYDTLTIDAGNLYGTTNRDGAYGYGSVFKLTHSGGGWTYTSLHDFTAGSDGGYVYGGVILDSSGNLYGTTQYGGSGGDTGVVWEITP